MGLGSSKHVLCKSDMADIDGILARLSKEYCDIVSSAYEWPIDINTPLSTTTEAEILMLSNAPLPVLKIKTGQLKKQGKKHKTWKRRFFHAFNKADNYIISYSLKEDGSAEKGRIICSGYHVEAFTKEELGLYGSYGIKLVPSDVQQRTWYLVADNESERREWETIFQYACRNATHPFPEDPTTEKASWQALTVLRRKYEVFNGNSFGLSSREPLSSALQKFFMDIVYQDKLQEVLEHWRSTSISSEGFNPALHQVYVKVSDTVHACTSRNLREIETREVCIPEPFSNRVRKLVLERVNFVFSDLSSKVLLPFLDFSHASLCEAFVDASSALCAELLNIFSRCKTNGHDLLLDLHNTLEISLDIHTSKCQLIENSQQHLWEWYTQSLACYSDVFGSSEVAFYCYCCILDSIRDLLRNALFEFRSTVDSSDVDSWLHCLFNTLKKFNKDSIVILSRETMRVVYFLTEITVQDSIICPCTYQLLNDGRRKEPTDIESKTSQDAYNDVTLELYAEKIGNEEVKISLERIVEGYVSGCIIRLDENYEYLWTRALAAYNIDNTG